MGLFFSRLSAAEGLAGATGACLATLIFYPVELIKTRMQVSMEGDENSFAYTGVRHAFYSILRTQGYHGLFAGLGPVVTRAIAFDFTNMYFSHLMRTRYTSYLEKNSKQNTKSDTINAKSVENATQLTQQKLKEVNQLTQPTQRPQLSTVMDMTFRTLAGWCNAVINLPLETISTRIQSAKSTKTVSEAVREVIKDGGFFGLYAGFSVSLILSVNPAMTFAIFDWLKKITQKCDDENQNKNGSSCKKYDNGGGGHAGVLFLLGILTKLVSLLLVYPLIRARALMQIWPDANMFSALSRVWKQEGLGGWYKGIGAQFGKSLLSTALLLTTKEKTMAFWKNVLVK